MDIKNKNRKPKIKGQLRRNQLITTMGAGSIVDLKNASVIIAGIETWENSNDIEDLKVNNIRLQNLLGRDYFLMPPFKKDKTEKSFSSYDVQAYRFPKWYYCEICKKLAPYTEFLLFNGKLVCEKCNNREVIPSRFVVACPKGHISDFPYREWVHKGPTDCKKMLEIIDTGETGELKSIKIRCQCGAYRDMGQTFSRNTFVEKCNGDMPWLGDKHEMCGEQLVTLQRSSSSVYFPITVSSILIPPWGKKISVEIVKYYEDNEEDYENKKELIERMIKRISRKYSISEIEAKNQIEAVLAEKAREDLTYNELIEDEYRALRIETNDETFITKEEKVPEFINKYIKKIMLVKKMIETIVEVGFKRINPEYDLLDGSTYTRLTDRMNQRWLPGINQKGEGIFIEFDEEKIKEWENRPEIIKRYKSIVLRKDEGYLKALKKAITPRTILLHTLSHAIIRQLTFECGYSSTSLKERIYTTFEEGVIDMAGILIYTTSSDSDGSLGGLVKQGRTKNLNIVLEKTLESMAWCSTDPLCIEKEQSGYKNLNLAACHACTLLPETSCELRNVLLDRAAIRGTLDTPKIGFLREFYRNEER